MACCAVGAWWWSQSSIRLNEEDYDLTIALYRVCNQRSLEGLASVERVFLDLRPSEQSDAARRQIAGIITNARDGRWELAMKKCRKSMEDQVRR